MIAAAGQPADFASSITLGAGDPRRAAAIPLTMAGIPGPPVELAPIRADTGSCGPKPQALQWIAAARQL